MKDKKKSPSVFNLTKVKKITWKSTKKHDKFLMPRHTYIDPQHEINLFDRIDPDGNFILHVNKREFAPLR